MKKRIFVLFITLAVVVSAVLSSCAIRIPDDGAVENTAGTGKEQTVSGSSLDLLLKQSRAGETVTLGQYMEFIEPKNGYAEEVSWFINEKCRRPVPDPSRNSNPLTGPNLMLLSYEGVYDGEAFIVLSVIRDRTKADSLRSEYLSTRETPSSPDKLFTDWMKYGLDEDFVLDSHVLAVFGGSGRRVDKNAKPGDSRGNNVPADRYSAKDAFKRLGEGDKLFLDEIELPEGADTGMTIICRSNGAENSLDFSPWKNIFGCNIKNRDQKEAVLNRYEKLGSPEIAAEIVCSQDSVTYTIDAFLPADAVDYIIGNFDGTEQTLDSLFASGLFSAYGNGLPVVSITCSKPSGYYLYDGEAMLRYADGQTR